MDRKRKMRDEDDSGGIMTLLKRLHLDKTSELFGKSPPPRPERKTPPLLGGKRWRLSPIQEHEGSGVKRRRIDSEMAEKMTNTLWISESAEREMAAKLDDDLVETDVTIPPGDVADDVTTSLENVTHVQINIPAIQSLEDRFIQREFQAQNLQLVLWTPPPVDIAALTEGRREEMKCYEECDEVMN